MKYFRNTKKLEELYRKLSNSEIDVDRLSKINIRRISQPYYKGMTKYESDWETGSTSLTVELKNFNEHFLRFIRVVPLTRTLSGVVAADAIDDFDLSMSLNQVSLEDTDLKKYKLDISLTSIAESSQQIYCKVMVLIINDWDFSEIRKSVI